MEKVRVYWNSHKKCYSVQKKQNRKWIVERHLTEIYLSDVTFSVSEAGRKRVLDEGRKNVHSYIEGNINGHLEPLTYKKDFFIGYNPYKYAYWYVKGTNSRIDRAELVYLSTESNKPIVRVML